MKDNYFYKDKNILVAGSSGFIGSHLTNKLSRLGANVVGTYLNRKPDKNLSKVIIELQNSINGYMNYYGNSFSKKPIKVGNLYQYYMQYIANYIFGHPSAIEPFKNDETIKKNISNIIDGIIDTFYDKDKLQQMIFEQFLKDDVIQFSENDILQFKITIQPPEVYITKNHKLDIPTTNWNIIIKMNSKK